MKKVIALLMCVLMIVGLTACGEKQPEAPAEAAVEAKEAAAPVTVEPKAAEPVKVEEPVAEPVVEPVAEEPVAEEPVVEEPVVEEPVPEGPVEPENAFDFGKIRDGLECYLVTIDGEYMWLGDNGWHVSLSAENKTPMFISYAGRGEYLFASNEWNMRLNVYEGKVDVLGAGVAMYPIGDLIGENERFSPEFISEDSVGFRLKTTGKLYLHCSSEEKDASLTDIDGATVFYLVKE